MVQWTFITRHGVVLSLISRSPRMTALEIAREVDITERAVRKIIADLKIAGYISMKRVGRGVLYNINPGLPLRQSTHREVVVGDLLATLGWNKNQND